MSKLYNVHMNQAVTTAVMRVLENRLRFNIRGTSFAEDLWQLPLAELDDLYGQMSEERKSTGKVSLVNPESKTKTNPDSDARFVYLEYVILTRLARQE